jgi:hypothetical protein
MNKLEQAMAMMSEIQSDIDTLTYAIGDAPRKYTEDELLNMLIGMSQLHQTRYDNLWVEYESFKRKNNAFDEDDIFDQHHLKTKENSKKINEDELHWQTT